MRRYCFDYIKELVDAWDPCIPRDYSTLAFTPYGLLLTSPIRDYYGVEVDDMQEWLRQREEYINGLVEGYEKQKVVKGR